MRIVKKNVIISLITLVLIVSGISYFVFVKGYWYYGTYTWDHSKIKRYTEEDYKKSTEFELFFIKSNPEAEDPTIIKERQEKLTKMIESGLEVNCPAPSYDIENMETDYVGLPLAVACSYKNYEIAKLLIEKGAVVGRIKGIPSPLGVTLNFYEKDDLEMVKFLLKNGADENVAAEGAYYTNQASGLVLGGGGKLSNKEDAHGATLIFKEIEAAGGAINQKQVVLATYSNNAELLNYLIEEKGMDLNKGLEFPQYFTPLTGACYQNALDTAKYLLEHGADKNLVNSQGKTAVDYAYTEEMKALLNQY